MQLSVDRFDVAIIGTGIAGSTLGTILASQGMRVILVESKSHPRFAIGESMILETSEMMRSLSEIYDIPELAYFSSENYFDHIGTSHGIKRHFSYAHHTGDEPFDKTRTLQAVIPRQPHGHELHLYRQDTDYFLMTLAIRYGATVLQNTSIQSVEIDTDGVQLSTTKGQTYQADYVVDAGGFRSLLSEKFDLRHHDLKTHSRAIFTHMLEVPCYHKVSATQRDYGLPFQLSEGTLHHVFEGGWLWVIPFNNHAKSTNPLCSVGLMLDPRVYPAQMDLSPGEEFYRFIDRFPGIAAQFRQAKPVRDWARTGRIQYSAKQVVGDRFCLLGQAAGFIDPLFSKGLYTALSCTSLLADRLLATQLTGDYSTQHFQPVEDLTLAYIQANDALVANAYKSFSDYQLWVPFSVVWLLGAYLELVKLTSARAQWIDHQDTQAYYEQLRSLRQVGGGFPAFEQLSNQIDGWLEGVNLDDAAAVTAVGEQIKQRLHETPWLPFAFKAILEGKNHLPNHKLHPRLLRPKQGFLGSGNYRRHFFGDRSLPFFINFYLQERAKYSGPVLNLKRTATLWQQGLRPQIAWGQGVAAAAVIATAGLIAGVPQSINGLGATTVQGSASLDQTVVGLVNLLEDPTGFQFACGNHAGRVVAAAFEGDTLAPGQANRLTIDIAYSGKRAQQTRITGTVDHRGIFKGTQQTQFADGSISSTVRLNFDPDGSAQGVHQEWGRAIAIQKI